MPASSDIDNRKIIAPFLAILTIIAVGAVLKVAQSVVLPLIIAWLLSYLLGPAISAMARRKIPTALSTVIILTILFVLLYLIGIFLYGRVLAIKMEYESYASRFDLMIQQAKVKWGFADVYFQRLEELDWLAMVGSKLANAAGTGISFVQHLLIVIIYLVFLLLGKPFFKYKLLKALDASQASRVDSIVSAIAGQISRYLYIQFLISFMTGFFVWLTLTIIKVDFAVTWGALAFMLNFIPIVGSIAASIPPILLAFIQYGQSSWWPGIATALSLLSIQMVIGNGIAPKVLGDSLNLSPVVVLLSLIFWGWLWGITGALLSIPIASAIKIVCENIGPLRPISIMMGSGKAYRHEFEAAG